STRTRCVSALRRPSASRRWIRSDTQARRESSLRSTSSSCCGHAAVSSMGTTVAGERAPVPGPARISRGSLQFDDLELEDPLGPGDRLRRISWCTLRGPGAEALVVGPAGHHEVVLLTGDRAQQLEALEAGGLIDGVPARREALLELVLLSLGDGESIDLDDGHRVLSLVLVSVWTVPILPSSRALPRDRGPAPGLTAELPGAGGGACAGAGCAPAAPRTTARPAGSPACRRRSHGPRPSHGRRAATPRPTRRARCRPRARGTGPARVGGSGRRGRRASAAASADEPRGARGAPHRRRRAGRRPARRAAAGGPAHRRSGRVGWGESPRCSSGWSGTGGRSCRYGTHTGQT